MNKLSLPLWRRLAWLWLLVVLATTGHNIWLWSTGAAAVDTNIMALLPQDTRDPIAEQALQRMAAAGEKRVVVLVGADSEDAARRAGDAYAARLAGLPLTLSYRVDAGQMGQWRDFFARHRLQLLSAEQRQRLATLSAQDWQQQSLQRLGSPAPATGLSWRDDPFNLFNDWMLGQAAEQRVRVNDGRLWLVADGRQWAVLMLTLRDSPLAMQTHDDIMPALAAATAAARSVSPSASIVQAGVLQFAHAATQQAQAEMSIIGLGSTLGVIALVLLVFRRARPLLLALLPIIIGTLAAISVTWLAFGGIHALTLVFGASLVGVAEDYGIHYLCMAYEDDEFKPFERMRRMVPGLLMAMLTTIIAYGGLALTPFPGLRQMALFAATGLLTAWLTTVLWLPWLSRSTPPLAGLALRIARSRPAWSRLLQGRSRTWVMLGIALVLVLGLPRVVIHDDLRLLQNAPPHVVEQQNTVSRLLGLPGPGQFYTVRAPSVEALLQQEEQLSGRLQALVERKVLTGYQTLSSQVPSRRTQQHNEALQRQLYAATLDELAAQLGADAGWKQRLLQPAAPLTVEQWLASPVSEGWRHLWLGRIDGHYASVVALRGVHGQAALDQLATLAGPHVSWTDKPAQISALMAHYRNRMAAVLAVSFVIVYLLLRRRYGKRCWRGLAPTLTGCLLTVAVLGLIGEPVQLFTVLGLFLVLGMGEDYGIFMLEHPNPEHGATWLAVSLAAVTTLLSFGLLAFSQTPALHSFGLATLIGIAVSWLLAPAFQPPGQFIPQDHHD